MDKNSAAAYRAMKTHSRMILDRNNFAVEELYVRLSSLAAPLLAECYLAPGAVYELPLETGSTLVFKFHNNGTGLIEQTVPEERAEIVPIGASFIDTKTRLADYERDMQRSGFGIGTPFPPEMVMLLTGLKKGETVTFDSGHSFVCIENCPPRIVLKPVCDRRDTIDLKKLVSKQDNESVEADDRLSLQRFWRKAKDPAQETAAARITTGQRAQEVINRVRAGISKVSKKGVRLGPVTLYVRQAFLGRDLVWSSETGRTIPEETVRLLIAWLDTSPVITEFERKNNKPNENDDNLKDLLSEALKCGDYRHVWDILKVYAKEKSGRVKIYLRSYMYESGNWQAVSFCFTADGVARFAHQDNDLSKPTILKDRKAEYAAFEKFCQAKYDGRYHLCIAGIRQEIFKQYPRIRDDILNNVAGRMAAKQAQKEAREDIEHDVSVIEEVEEPAPGTVPDEPAETTVEATAETAERAAAESPAPAQQPETGSRDPAEDPFPELKEEDPEVLREAIEQAVPPVGAGNSPTDRQQDTGAGTISDRDILPF